MSFSCEKTLLQMIHKLVVYSMHEIPIRIYCIKTEMISEDLSRCFSVYTFADSYSYSIFILESPIRGGRKETCE
jgi:hypothetical protein